MKKSLIAAAGASVAAVAMPAVSVFAATTTQLVDTVKVSVVESCTIETTDDNNVTPGPDGNVINKKAYGPYTVVQGQVLTNIGASAGPTTGEGASPASDEGGDLNVVCSENQQGGGSSITWTLSAEGTNMVGTTQTNIIPAAAPSDDTSYFAYKVTGGNSSVTSYSMVPATRTQIANGTGSASFKMRYEVGVASSQALDTYTGTVTYTLVAAQ